jgi:hypothetical protein
MRLQVISLPKCFVLDKQNLLAFVPTRGREIVRWYLGLSSRFQSEPSWRVTPLAYEVRMQSRSTERGANTSGYAGLPAPVVVNAHAQDDPSLSAHRNRCKKDAGTRGVFSVENILAQDVPSLSAHRSRCKKGAGISGVFSVENVLAQDDPSLSAHRNRCKRAPVSVVSFLSKTSLPRMINH